MRPLMCFGIACASAGVLFPVADALAQSATPALFVANNGNREGSVTSFRVNPDGSLAFASRVITGSTDVPNGFHPGLNCYAITLSPSGRYLACSHTTASTTTEWISLFEVGADGSLTLLANANTPDSPLDVLWIDDRTLAATRTTVSGTDDVVVYALDAVARTLTEIDREGAGTNCAYLAKNPTGSLLFAPDSQGFGMRVFRTIESLPPPAPQGRRLELASTYSSGGVYPLGPGVTPDGKWLYAGGGISVNGNRIPGWSITESAASLEPLVNSPFTSPGESPKVTVASADSRFLYVGHGTDATIRVFSIDEEAGDLSPLPFSFDVGLQGTLGDIALLPGLLFVSDNSTALDGLTGVYAFRLNADGSMTMIGTGPVSSQGIAPTFLAAWDPPAPACRADFNDDDAVDSQDLFDFLVAFFALEPAGDFNADGFINSQDFFEFLAAFFAGC